MMKIQVQDIPDIIPEDEAEKTKEDYTSFWEQWDFYDSERGQ